MSSLLNLILLSFGWMLVMEVGGFKERKATAVGVGARRLPGLFRGPKAHCSLKKEYRLSIGNLSTLPCSVAGKDL